MRILEKKDIQMNLFEILCFFADICERHKLRYGLCGGTLLGAVRHKGFIPWDDDTDVFMPRPDYMRLHKILSEKSLPKKYKFKSNLLGNSIYPTAKIVDVRTYTQSEYMELDSHLFLDIFPVDGLPEKQDDACDYLNKAKIVKKTLYLSLANIGKGKSATKKIAKIPFVMCAKLIGNSYWSNKLDSMARKYDFNKCTNVGAVASSCGYCELFAKKDFLSLSLYEFNGRNFYGPADADAYLSRLYGDYMKLPPVKDREYHYKKVYLFD